MSVEDILLARARAAGDARLRSAQIWGQTIQGLGQIPAQLLDQRRQDSVLARQQAREDEALGYKREAAGRERADYEQATAVAKTEAQKQQILGRANAAAFADDPMVYNLDKAAAQLTADGHPEFLPIVHKVYQDNLPKLTAGASGSVMRDERGQVVEGSAIPPVKPDYTIEGQRFSGDATPIGPRLLPADKVTVGSFEDYVRRVAEGKGLALKDLKPADIEAARKAYQQADDRPRVNVSVGAGGGGGLDPDAVAYTATQYRILGASGIPTRIGEGDKVHILNEAAKQAKMLGQSPAQAVQKQAAFKADGASLTKITTMAAAAEAFETKAAAQAELVRTLSTKVPRTAYPIINGALVSGQAAMGDTEAHLFANALLTFTTEYAKLMEGSTGSAAGSSEGARRDAAKLISVALNNGTIDKTLTQMQWEMQQTRRGYDVTIGHITEKMGGAPPAATPKPGEPLKVGGFTVKVKE